MERKEGPSPKETANSVGYVVGFVFGKKLVFDRVLIQLIRKDLRKLEIFGSKC